MRAVRVVCSQTISFQNRRKDGGDQGVGVCVSEPLVNVVAKQRGAICQGSRPGLG